MKELFLAITARLQECEALAWIDEDAGQIDRYDMRPDIALPAALVSISYPTTQDTGPAEDQEQIVTARITVRLVFDAMGESYTAAPEEVRATALARFDTAQEVHRLLQGFSDENQMNALTRLSMTPEPRRDGYKVVRAVYETNFIEAPQKPAPQPSIFNQIWKELDGFGNISGEPGDLVDILPDNTHVFQTSNVFYRFMFDDYEDFFELTILPIKGRVASSGLTHRFMRTFRLFDLLFQEEGSLESPAAYYCRFQQGKGDVNVPFNGGERIIIRIEKNGGIFLMDEERNILTSRSGSDQDSMNLQLTDSQDWNELIFRITDFEIH